MPELPEVETVKRGLEQLVVGKTFANIEVKVPKMVTTGSQALQAVLPGQTIQNIDRRGKFLIFQCTQGAILSHLRMEGKYFIQPDNVDQHVHVIFHFTDGTSLYYRDVRKFGRFAYYPGKEVWQSSSVLKLGMEPFADSLDEARFYRELLRYRSAIKTVLLNQKVVAGLGNIYVDEVLFRAHIHPLTRANQLSKAEVHRLRCAIIDVIHQAIEAKGTTIRTYENAFGENGTYQQHLQVYGRENQSCVRCGHPIQKIKVNGRGTHFCPHCQREKQ